MRLFYFTIALILFSTQLLGQKRELRNGLEDVNSRGFYEVTFDKYYSHKKIQKWIDKNDLLIVDAKYGNFMKFGKVKEGVIWLEYTNPRKYYRYLALMKKREERSRENGSDWSAVVGGIILGAVAVAGVKALSDYSSSSNSSNRRVRNNDDCGCNIRKIKDEGWLIKNGYQTVTFDNGYAADIEFSNGKWRLKGWFIDKSFDSYEKLVQRIYRDCKIYYCK